MKKFTLSYLMPYIKINSKQVVDLKKLNYKSYKCKEDSYDFGLEKFLRSMTPKAWSIKNLVSRTSSKLKTFCSSDIIKKMKRHNMYATEKYLQIII